MQVRALASATALTVLLASACKSIPRDPEHTLEHVEHGVLRVGAADHHPFVTVRPGADRPVSGVEVDLVKELAQELGARVEWTVGESDALLASLEHFDLDLVVAGLTDDSPWAKRVAFTKPYSTDHVCFGVAPGVPLGELRGRQVTIERDAPFGHALTKKDAVAFRVVELAAATPPVLAPDWQIDALGWERTNECVQKEAHVFAVPPGENRFALRVERFLIGRSGTVYERLREATRAATAARMP